MNRDFLALLLISLVIWNNGYQMQDFSFLLNANYWLIGVYTFFLIGGMWHLHQELFHFIGKKHPIEFDKARTLMPYFLGSSVILGMGYPIGFSFLFALPAPNPSTTHFTLDIASILFSSFLFSSSFLYSRLQKDWKGELQLLQSINAQAPKMLHSHSLQTLNPLPLQTSNSLPLSTSMSNQASISTLPSTSKYLQVRRGTATLQIPIETIHYFHLQDSFVYLTQSDGTSFAILETLAQIKKQCTNSDLFAANRQFLISKKSVKSWKRTSTRKLSLELFPAIKEEVTVSKNKAPVFLEWIKPS